MSKLLSPEALAEALAVSKPTAYRLIASRAIPSIVVGRSIRVRQTALDEYLTAHERSAIDLDSPYDGRRRRGA